MLFFTAFLLLAGPGIAATTNIANKDPKAGGKVEISGKIAPGKDLYVVICSEKLFKPGDSIGSKENAKLSKLFGDTAIPPVYYVLSNSPGNLATPKVVSKGRWFPPFKWDMEVNKTKKWGKIPEDVRLKLGPINTEKQWNFLIYTHEKKFGINTVSKERPIGGGNARMIMGGDTGKNWNEGVKVSLDKKSGDYSVSFKLSKQIPPDTPMSIYVNGENLGKIDVQKRGFYFKTGGTYMNPLIVLIGSFLIGCMFVIVGAAGGLFTAAFQITIIGTNGWLA